MLLLEECNGVKDAIVIILREDPCSNEIQGICFDNDWSVVVEVAEDRYSGKGYFQGFDSHLVVIIPHEGDFIVCQAGQWGDDMGVVLDEPGIEVCKANEPADIGDIP